jgi:3-oxoacyl-[acyl-carrier-protein] synthase II
MLPTRGPAQHAPLDSPKRVAVAVTGVGVVSPIGIGREQFWAALCAGVSGVRPFDAGTGCLPHVAAQVGRFASRQGSHLRRADPLSRTVVTAATQALADAGLDAAALAPARLAIVVGSAFGNVRQSVQYLERLFTKEPGLASPLLFPNLVLNAPASYTAMEVGSVGANLTVQQGEISGEQAVALGCDLIRAGRADVVLAGGGDEIAEIVVSAYRDYRALSGQRGGAEWCSPYDANRNGVVLGEGAAMLVLESAEHVRQRGAAALARIVDHVSFGMPAEPYDWPAHAGAAPARLQRFLAACVGREMESASLGIDLICGGANSSRRLDACELDVLGRLFGEAAAGVTLTSIKGAIGEFGTAGALTAVAASLALRNGVVPPLCHLRDPAPGALFRFAGRTGTTQALRRALMFGIARGGATSAIVLERAPQ